MEYDENSVLPKHLELVSNEVSMTLCFYRNSESPLFFDRRWQENKYDGRFTAPIEEIVPARETSRIDLKMGDIGIFNGRNHLHWRDAATHPLTWRGVLFHFMHFYDDDSRMSQISWGHPDEQNSVEGPVYKNLRQGHVSRTAHRSEQ